MTLGQSFYFNKDDIFPVKPESRFFVYILIFFGMFFGVVEKYIHSLDFVHKLFCLKLCLLKQ